MQNDQILKVRYGKYEFLLPPRDLLLYYETFVLGQYRFLAIRKGDCVLDAGANIGDFSILAAAAVESKGLVLALEPDPFYHSILQENIRLNGLQNHCVALRAALASYTGTVFLGPERLKSSTGIEAPTVTIADLLSKNRLSHFDVVKMDIEGAEETIFRDTSWIHAVRELAVETHGKTERTVIKALESNGFRTSLYREREMVLNTLAFVLFHPFDFMRVEALSRGMALRRLLAYPRSPPLIVSRLDPSHRIVNARRIS